MQLIVVDLEATCWAEPRPRDRMEIIEIGAVRLDAALDVVDELGVFVRPVVEPTLSAFCTELTSITQADVDAADPFSLVFPTFIDWIGDVEHRLCSWGFYDVGQLHLDCQRHGITFPADLETGHLNIKAEFAAWKGVRRCGMAKALDLLGMPLVGTHHRGIDDARNIAKITQRLFADRPFP